MRFNGLLLAAGLVMALPTGASADAAADCAELAARAANEAIATLTAMGHPDAESTRANYQRQLTLGWNGCATLSAEALACLRAAPSIGRGLASCNVNAGRDFPSRLRLPALTSVAYAMRPAFPAPSDPERAAIVRDLVGTYVRDDGDGRAQTLEFRADGTVRVIRTRTGGAVESDETFRMEVRSAHSIALEQVGGTRRFVWTILRVGSELVSSDNANDAPVAISADGAATVWAVPVARVEALRTPTPRCRAFGADGVEATAVSCSLGPEAGGLRTLTITYTPPPSTGGDGTVYGPTRGEYWVAGDRIVPATRATRFSRREAGAPGR